jgi:hypothetical protein
MPTKSCAAAQMVVELDPQVLDMTARDFHCRLALPNNPDAGSSLVSSRAIALENER